MFPTHQDSTSTSSDDISWLSWLFLKCLDPLSQPTDWEPWHTNQLGISNNNYMTYWFQVKTSWDFCICCVPTDLHATNGDKVLVFCGAKFADKISDFFHLISDRRMSMTIAWSWGKIWVHDKIKKGIGLWHVPCQRLKISSACILRDQ